MALQKVITKAAGKAAQAAGSFVKFGRRDSYVSGGGLPEGNYVLFFEIMDYQAVDKTTGAAKGDKRLGVMVKAHNLEDLAAEPKSQFYSMGRNANKSFQPDPDTGTRIVPIAGAPPAQLYRDTNWQIFLDELYNAGLPDGIFEDDVAVLNGVHVHVHPIPEPESRKSMTKIAVTSEVGATQGDYKPGTIAVVTEILEGGAPWDGGGGLPTGKATTKAAGGKPNGKAVAVAAPAPAAAENDDALQAAEEGLSAVFEIDANTQGMPKTKARVDAINHIIGLYGEEVASAATEAVFDQPDRFGAVLGKIGYSIKGLRIVPAA